MTKKKLKHLSINHDKGSISFTLRLMVNGQAKFVSRARKFNSDSNTDYLSALERAMKTRDDLLEKYPSARYQSNRIERQEACAPAWSWSLFKLKEVISPQISVAKLLFLDFIVRNCPDEFDPNKLSYMMQWEKGTIIQTLKAFEKLGLVVSQGTTPQHLYAVTRLGHSKASSIFSCLKEFTQDQYEKKNNLDIMISIRTDKHFMRVGSFCALVAIHAGLTSSKLIERAAYGPRPEAQLDFTKRRIGSLYHSLQSHIKNEYLIRYIHDEQSEYRLTSKSHDFLQSLGFD